jgi:phospholipid transport system substrate-binding protein
MKPRLFVAVTITMVLALARLAAAGEPTDTLRTRVDEVLRLLEQPGHHRAQLRKLAEGLFDAEEMSRRALGPHWNARTPEERRQFVQLFADLLERSYLSRVESGRGGTVLYTAESVSGEEATVRTKIITPQRTEVPVDYRMLRRDNRWQVYDVNIEGVSLISNYRSQFNSVIQSSGYAALVERLRSKESDGAASPTPPRRRRE